MKETIEILENFDENLFKLINETHGPVMDEFMLYASTKWISIPVYVIVLFLFYRQYGWKGMLVILGCGGLLVALTDLSSVYLFKEMFQRYRPCHNEDFGHLVHTVEGHCGGQYGFVSSHAANLFGLAYFCGRLARDKYTGIMGLLMIWAAIIGYSRIYLGVHFPADVIAGALLGIILGIGVFWLCRYILHKVRVLT